MQKQLSEGFFKQDVIRNFAEFAGEKSVPESLLWYFLVNFAKLVR